MTFRPAFEAALRLFARISEATAARGLSRPILVGQAHALMRLHPDLDMVYLENRVRHETGGDFGAQNVIE